jgi:hypothetical protein
MKKFDQFISEEYKKYNPFKSTHEPYKIKGDYKTTIKMPYDMNHPLFKKNMMVDVYTYTRSGVFFVELVNKKYSYVITLEGYDSEKEFKDDGWKI